MDVLEDGLVELAGVFATSGDAGVAGTTTALLVADLLDVCVDWADVLEAIALTGGRVDWENSCVTTTSGAAIAAFDGEAEDALAGTT